MEVVVSNPKREWTVKAVATFVELMHARERGEMATAAAAQVELARLGVVVQVRGPKRNATRGPFRA